jgi:hypothetical protein
MDMEVVWPGAAPGEKSAAAAPAALSASHALKAGAYPAD